MRIILQRFAIGGKNVPADSLIRLQLKYNLQLASNDQTFMERLNKIRQYAALL
jgi:hypothetical protein